jgi:hypothetical protein
LPRVVRVAWVEGGRRCGFGSWGGDGGMRRVMVVVVDEEEEGLDLAVAGAGRRRPRRGRRRGVRRIVAVVVGARWRGLGG